MRHVVAAVNVVLFLTMLLLIPVTSAAQKNNGEKSDAARKEAQDAVDELKKMRPGSTSTAGTVTVTISGPRPIITSLSPLA
jgi:hypothetical protein